MDAQTIVALIIVAASLAYLIHRGVALARGKAEPGCHSGGCSSCIHNTACSQSRPEKKIPSHHIPV